MPCKLRNFLSNITSVKNYLYFRIMSIYLSLFLLIISQALLAQSTYAPMNKDYYNLIDRYEIRNGNFVPGMHTSYKEYRRADIVGLLDSLSLDSTHFSTQDKFNVDYLNTDNWQYGSYENALSKKPFLNHFYTTKSDLYSVNTDDFRLRVNPVLYWQAGKESDNPNSLYMNTRGVQVEGDIDKKISFYTFLADNQAVFADYAQLEDQITLTRIIDDTTINRSTISSPAVKGESFVKPFKNGQGRDFFTARGYVNFGVTRHVDVQFGHGRQFIGNGYRSLILSDYAPDYLFLKFNTSIWKIKYTNLFAEMNASSRLPSDPVIPKKYLALHHLSINLLKNLNVGVFESIAYGGRANKLELNYMNPIIFYRSVEQTVGSPDNAILGLDLHYNFLKHFQFYNQVVLDEFVLSHVRARDGWWANKQAIQLGMKYIDVAGISNLDLQGEINAVRPYMYTHDSRDSKSYIPAQNYSNYQHYMQPLAHPFGANFKEYIGIIRYQPISKLTITAKAMIVRFGADTGTSNWGGNILLSNAARSGGILDNRIGQGVGTTLLKLDIVATYMIKHNVFFDLNATIREIDSAIDAADTKSMIVGGAFRWNIGQRLHDF